MQASDAIELLGRFARERSDDAFAAIVSHYVKLVYSAALRQVRDRDLAHDVTQSVFVLLARKAKSLPTSVVLSGWLYRATGYVASDAIRAETRRRKREEIAMEQFHETESRAVWRDVEPILDEAIRELGKQEREFVLLRFFENKSLREIGEVMGVSEDAAQKRVARALEQLRNLLGRRCVKVSSTALGGALLTYSCANAPASIISVTTLSAATITTTFFSKTAIDFMAMTKLKVAVAVVAVAGTVSAPIISQQRTISELRAENQRLVADVAQLKPEAQPVAQTGVTDEELQRLRNDAEEVHRLRAQVAALSQGQAPGRRLNRPTAAPSTAADELNEESAKDPMKRQTLAKKLMGEGKYAEALEHYLWCWDNGDKSLGYGGVRRSFLVNDMKALARKYPEAREALITRRDALEESILATQAFDPMLVLDLVGLDDSVDDPNRLMTFFDKLPSNHEGRAHLVSYATESFVKANRYLDIVNYGDPEKMVDQALFGAASASNMDKSDPNGAMRASTRRYTVGIAGRNIEALAGAGEVNRAIALVDKIYKFDSSDDTKRELLQFAQRAGNGTVVEHIRAK